VVMVRCRKRAGYSHREFKADDGRGRGGDAEMGPARGRRAIVYPDWRYERQAWEAAGALRAGVWQEQEALVRKAKPLLSRIRKRRASTTAGVYSKALLVRNTRTGAPLLRNRWPRILSPVPVRARASGLRGSRTMSAPDPFALGGRQDIEQLPFVGRRDSGEPGFPRHFWKVRSIDNGPQDCALGGEYALAYLRFEAAEEHKLLLPWIVKDMPRELTQLEIAFLALVGEAACAGRYQAEAVEAYYRACRNGWRSGASSRT
jgi:hypothetical protein